MLPRIHPARSTPSTAPETITAALTTVRRDGARALICAIGEWDLANADALAEQLQAHATAGRRFVRLDLSAVSFLTARASAHSSLRTTGS